MPLECILLNANERNKQSEDERPKDIAETREKSSKSKVDVYFIYSTSFPLAQTTKSMMIEVSWPKAIVKETKECIG